jgi:tetratricopeptide (TPR) repeat protein
VPASEDEIGRELEGARVLLSEARSLVGLGELETAISVFSEIAETYGEAIDPEVGKVVRMALGAKAGVLGMTGRRAEEIVVTDALVYGSTDDEADPLQLLLLAGAMGANGMALIGDERYHEALQVLDDLVWRFKDAQEPELRGAVALAISNQSAALACLGFSDQAMRAHDDMVADYGEDAVIVFEELAARYAKQTRPQAREHLAVALHNKAWVLRDLGRRDEGAVVLRELLNGFGDNEAGSEKVEVVVEVARRVLEEISEDSERG